MLGVRLAARDSWSPGNGCGFLEPVADQSIYRRRVLVAE
jgi:hypothetical protein